MLTLVLDTSSERGIVALLKENRILFRTELPVGYQSAQYLTAELTQGLDQLQVSPSSIAQIILGCGPGSYTGIRVAAAVGKTLSYACKIPLVGVCSLEGFVPPENGSFAVLMDARLSGVYLLKGSRQGERIEYFCSPHLCSWKDLPAQLKDVSYLISPYSARLQVELQKLCPDSTRWQWCELAPCVQRLNQQGQKLFANQKFSITGDIDLIYLRKTQAELERE